MPTKRARKAVLQFLAQAGEGVPASPTGTDAIEVENLVVTTDPDIVQTDEHRDTLDQQEPLIGGMKCTASFTAYLKGADLPGEIADWDDLARCSSLKRTQVKQTIAATTISIVNPTRIADSGNGLAALTVGTAFHIVTAGGQRAEGNVTVSAAGQIDFVRTDSGPALVAESAGATFTIRYGVAGTAATAGTAFTATLQAPFVATADFYRGQPAWLSGNPAAPTLALVSDYTVARVMSFAQSFSPVLSAATKVSIPPNVWYQPTSVAADIPWGTGWFYFDGVRHRFQDMVGTGDIVMESGRPWKLNCRMTGLLQADPDDAVAPASSFDPTRPGVWKNSGFLIDRVAAGLASASLMIGAENDYPPNPNKPDGYDAPVHVNRAHRFSADPNITSMATRNLIADMRAGNRKLVAATMRGGHAAIPGNRLGVMIPRAFLTGANHARRGNFNVEQMEAAAATPDAGFMLSVF
jgi:hypothetical protein